MRRTINMVRTSPATMTNMPIRNCMTRSFMTHLRFAGATGTVDNPHHGIGWELLAHIARYADTKGLRSLESIESRDNHEAIELERDMGFVISDYPGDSTLVLVSRSHARA